MALGAVKGVETVFRFATNPEVSVSVIEPRTHFENNVVANFNLLEAMRRENVKEIVFASSSIVYKEPRSYIYIDDAMDGTLFVYNKTAKQF